MAESLDALPERVNLIGRKLDELSSSVDKRFADVSEHFVEQRQYTEFAFARLEQVMTTRFDRLERKLDQFIDGQSKVIHHPRLARRPKKP